MTPTWDILIATIPHRHQELCELLATFDEQMPDRGVQVLLYRDNLELSYGAKTQALLNASAADYVCCFDDDDLPAENYVAAIRGAFKYNPDYVGFKVKYTVDGDQKIPVVHSLRYDHWNRIDDQPKVLERDIVQFNPIRRELALLGRWDGGWQADYRWANEVRATGKVQSEVFIDAELYWKRDLTAKDFRRGHLPWPHAMPAMPVYPWLVTL